jgi:hypothetical protein
MPSLNSTSARLCRAEVLGGAHDRSWNLLRYWITTGRHLKTLTRSTSDLLPPFLPLRRLGKLLATDLAPPAAATPPASALGPGGQNQASVAGIAWWREAYVNEQAKQDAVATAATFLGGLSPAAEQALAQLWDAAFEEGRLAALDELQDRLCVCMK